MEWNVRIETASPDDVLLAVEGGRPPVPGVELGELELRFGQMLDKLADHGAVGGLNADGWDLVVTIDVPDLPEAPQLAVETVGSVVLGAARSAGLPSWRVVSVCATEAELDWARSDAQTFPDIVGVQEVLGILGVSKQRLSQLRQADRFPEPMLELGATPVWMRAAVERFNETRPGPGRPRSEQSALVEVAPYGASTDPGR